MSTDTLTPEFHTDEVTFDVLEGDPYALFERMRRHAPVHHAERVGLWIVTSWDECARIAALPEAHRGGSEDDGQFFGRPNVLSMTGEDHQRMRAGIDAELRPRVVRRYADELARPVVVEYMERIRGRGQADLTTELFELISVRVIGNKLGLGDIDDDRLVLWFKTLSNGIEAIGREDDDTSRATARTMQEIDDYLRDRVEHLREHPDSSIISHILHTGTADGTPRTYEEVIGTIRVIILGGFQEPGNAVANTFHGLLGRPDQLARLVAEPERYAAPALEEGLRWIAPIGAVDRTALVDIETPWATIPAGEHFMFAVGAANRDRDRFDHADEYDLDRVFLPHATFGYGEHFCAGHALARGLAEIIIEETVRRLPGLRRDPEGEVEVSGFFFRGAKHLPAVWDVDA